VSERLRRGGVAMPYKNPADQKAYHDRWVREHIDDVRRTRREYERQRYGWEGTVRCGICGAEGHNIRTCGRRDGS